MSEGDEDRISVLKDQLLDKSLNVVEIEQIERKILFLEQHKDE